MTVRQLVFVGDSTTQGTQGGFNMALGGSGCWQDLVTERLANIASVGPLISSGFRGCHLGRTASGYPSEWSIPASTTAVTSADAWDVYPYVAGTWSNGAAKIWTWTKPASWRPIIGFALYWVNKTSGGNWQYRVDGGTWTNMGQTLGGATANKLCKFYVSTAVASTVDIRASSDASTGVDCFPAGIEVYYLSPSTTQGLIVHNIAVNGSQLRVLVNTTAGDRLAFLDSVQLGTGSPVSPSPNAGVLMLHINDVTIANTTTWATDLTTLNTRAAPLGPVGFINVYECNTVSYNQTQQTNYRAQTKTTAAGFATPAKVLDLYDALNSFGYVAASTGLVAADSGNTQTASLVGTQSLTVTSTTGFPKGGEFALTGTNGTDSKITYSTIDSTHFYGCKLVTGSDFQMVLADVIALTQNAGLNTAGFLLDGTHQAQLGHLWMAERIYWFIRNQILGTTTSGEPTVYPVSGTKASVAHTGTKASVAYSSGLPVGVG